MVVTLVKSKPESQIMNYLWPSNEICTLFGRLWGALEEFLARE